MTAMNAGRQAILNHPDGPTTKELDYWVAKNLLRPVRRAAQGSAWRGSIVWEPEERRVAVIMARLYRVGFKPAEAARLARMILNRLHRGNPVVIRLDGGITLEVHVPLRSKND